MVVVLLLGGVVVVVLEGLLVVVVKIVVPVVPDDSVLLSVCVVLLLLPGWQIPKPNCWVHTPDGQSVGDEQSCSPPLHSEAQLPVTENPVNVPQQI